MTLEEKVSQMQNQAAAIPRLGVYNLFLWEIEVGCDSPNMIRITTYLQQVGQIHFPLFQEGCRTAAALNTREDGNALNQISPLSSANFMRLFGWDHGGDFELFRFAVELNGLQEQSALGRSEMVIPNPRAPVVNITEAKSVSLADACAMTRCVLKAGSLETIPKSMLFSVVICRE
jgi:hypothetical protein